MQACSSVRQAAFGVLDAAARLADAPRASRAALGPRQTLPCQGLSYSGAQPRAQDTRHKTALALSHAPRFAKTRKR